MKYVMIGLIYIYQKIPGPWHDCCKYKPTCSNYAIGVLMIRRLLKCNFFSKGGYDPIPSRKKTVEEVYGKN